MQQNKPLLLRNLHIHKETHLIESGSVFVKNKTIHAINEKIIEPPEGTTVLDFPSNFHLVPGFIDVHVHGANNSDVMDANQEGLINISETLAKEGTTSFLATTMSASIDHIEKTLCAIRDFMSQQEKINGATILGAHLEGPFISPKKANAQNAEHICLPDFNYIKKWQHLSGDVIKMVTFAPELANSLELIDHLRSNRIVASMGHTDATFEEMQKAIDAGCTHATHLFNAMRGLHQREPGAVTAALLSPKVMTELICDGIHLHPAILKLALKLKGNENIALVTDSMRAKCMQNGLYDLGGQSVTVNESVARLADGTLAGSTLKMNSAIKNFMQFTECSLFETIRMAAENPAKGLGVFDKKGSIAVSKDADLVVLDNELEVAMTIKEGQIIYDNFFRN